MSSIPTRRIELALVTAVCVTAPLAGDAAAQGGLFVPDFVIGPDPVAAIGNVVVGVPDADGDGYGDVAVGNPLFGPVYRGRVRLYSGLTRTLVQEWPGPAFNPCLVAVPGCLGESFGTSLAAADWDGDGLSDIVIGAPGHMVVVNGENTGRVEVRRGVDGSLLESFVPSVSQAALGYDLDVVGDLTGDGLPELVINAPSQQDFSVGFNVGFFHVFSAPSFSTLYSYSGWQPGQIFGGFSPYVYDGGVRRAGDADGDGVPDFMVGASRTGFAFQLDGTGLVRVYSGATGTIIRSWPGTPGTYQRGLHVSPLGDVNGDGADEVVFVERVYIDPSTVGPALLHVVDPATGQFVYSITDFGPGYAWVERLPDIDEDGIPELLTAASGSYPYGIIQVRSGVDGTILFSTGLPGAYPFAKGLSSIDLNADGLSDFVCSTADASWVGPQPGDQIRGFVARNLSVVTPLPGPGGTLSYKVRAPALAGRPYQLVLSATATTGFPVGPFRVPLDPDPLFVASFQAFLGGTLDAQGKATYAHPVPNDPALTGATIHASGAIYDPAGPLGIRTILTRETLTIQ